MPTFYGVKTNYTVQNYFYLITEVVKLLIKKIEKMCSFKKH